MTGMTDFWGEFDTSNLRRPGVKTNDLSFPVEIVFIPVLSRFVVL